MEAKQATLHHELIAQLLDSRIPKTEREHAAAREIERLRADLLQEMVEAPEPEPVARVTGYYAGYLSIATVDGRVLPAGTALYAAPPHQSEQHLEMVNTPAPSVPDGWRSAIAKEFPLYDEGEIDEDKHCCEWVMLQERKRLHKMLSAAPTPAEPPADVVRDAERWRMLPAFLEEFEISYLRLEDAIDAAIAAGKGGA